MEDGRERRFAPDAHQKPRLAFRRRCFDHRGDASCCRTSVKENFDSAFAALIGNEGGYVFDPRDPGGETMYGITSRVAAKHGYAGAMRDLPLELAKSIAKTEYWD